MTEKQKAIFEFILIAMLVVIIGVFSLTIYNILILLKFLMVL